MIEEDKINAEDKIHELWEYASSLKKQLEILSTHIWEWCDSINNNGSGYDYWDFYYKEVYWNKETLIYNIVNNYRLKN